MTRRERHIRIVENFGLDSQSTRYWRAHLLARRGLAAFTDEAVRELATMLVRGRAHQNRINAENRKRRQSA